MRIGMSILLFLVVSINLNYAQIDTSFSKILVLQSQEIDYFPVWDESEDYIYINLLSKDWRKYELKDIALKEITYIQYKIGVNNSGRFSIVDSPSLIKQLSENESWRPREIVDSSQRTISVTLNGFNSVLKIDGQKIMDIGGNAYSLAVSPSGKYVAFIIELAGLMVIDIEKELTLLKEEEIRVSKMANLDKAAYHLEKGEFDLLEQTLETFNSNEKEMPDYQFYAGILDFVRSNSDSSYVDRAIKKLMTVSNNPQFVNANLILGELYLIKKDWPNTFTFANKIIDLFPDRAEGYFILGEYYSNKGDTELACKNFQLAYDKGNQWAQLKLIGCNESAN